MPRVRGARSVLPSWRASIGLALGRSALGALSLGPPRVSPPPPVDLPDGPLGAAVRPHRRRLWRGRALHVLTRAFTLAMGWLLLAAIVSWRLAVLPRAVFWFPAACVLLAGIWLAFAQRPTALETARLLDRRFHLRDVLGTAVEISGQGDLDEPLPRRQIAAALGLFNRVPHTAWMPAPRREWLVGAILAALSLVVVAAAPQHVGLAATGSGPGRHVTAVGQHPLALAQGAIAPRSGGYAGLNSPGSSTTRITAKARIPALSLSLQIHASSQGGQSSAPGVNPYLTGGSMGGGSGGAVHQGAKGAKGTAGGGSGGQGQQGAGGGSQQSSGTGQPGGKGQGQGQHGLQAPQNGQQSSSSQTGQSGSAGGAQPGQSQSQDPQSSNSGQAPPSANPFGHDQSRPGSHSSRTSPSPRSGHAQQGGRQPTTANGKRTGPGSSTSAHSPNGQGDPGFLRRGQHGANPPTTQQPRVATHGAGPATGPNITLGGHYVINPGDQGQGLVRIEPRGVATGTGLQGAGYAGSATVQGYVPETATALSPEEQALVRAYFSGNGN